MALLYPLTTEKAIGMIEKENKVTFIVDKKATKKEIVDEFEKNYNVKVESVHTLVTPKGKRKAFIRLQKGYSADEIATKLKMV
jgi:large subunit ribosomal protein L23